MRLHVLQRGCEHPPVHSSRRSAGLRTRRVESSRPPDTRQYTVVPALDSWNALVKRHGTTFDDGEMHTRKANIVCLRGVPRELHSILSCSDGQRLPSIRLLTVSTDQYHIN